MKWVVFPAILAIMVIASPGWAENEAELIVGSWVGDFHGDEMSFTFTEDGKFVLGGPGFTMNGTYTLDLSASPPQMDLVPDDDPEDVGRTIFEFIDNDHVRIEEPDNERPAAFTDSAILFARGEAAVSGAIETPGDAPGLLVGTWSGDVDGELFTIFFNEDGTFQIDEGAEKSVVGNYLVDYSANPAWLDLTTSEGRSETGYTIFELVGENQVRIEEPSSKRPVEFTDLAVLLDRQAAPGDESSNDAASDSGDASQTFEAKPMDGSTN